MIASTIVTADCTDQGCKCALRPDSESPDKELLDDEDHTHRATSTDLAMQGMPAYDLVPVITTLPTITPIATAPQPSDVGVKDVITDAISQAAAIELPDEPEAAPALTASVRRRQARARPAWALSFAEIVEIVENAPSLENALAAEIQSATLVTAAPAPTANRNMQDQLPLARRPLLQDAYIAFGVNGR